MERLILGARDYNFHVVRQFKASVVGRLRGFEVFARQLTTHLSGEAEIISLPWELWQDVLPLLLPTKWEWPRSESRKRRRVWSPSPSKERCGRVEEGDRRSQEDRGRSDGPWWNKGIPLWRLEVVAHGRAQGSDEGIGAVGEGNRGGMTL